MTETTQVLPQVLLVQAEPSLMRSLFVEAGMQVAEARSGAEALQALAAGLPDLVVLGRALGDVDGLSLLGRVKAGEYVPVLVTSGPCESKERVRGLQLGADDWLTEPWDPAELLARARALLRTKRAHDQLRAMQTSLEGLIANDPLTRLHNRRYTVDRLRQEMQRAERHDEDLSFALLDLDGFGPLNEQFGRALGDRILRAVADTLSRSVRVSDVAARFGGDEFALILPQTPPEGAMRVCERVLRAIAAIELFDDSGVRVPLTASLGFAYYPEEDLQTPEDLIDAAELALHGARRAGRNRFNAARARPPASA